jgi:hypothetical protein
MSILRYAYATGALLLGGSLQAAQIEEPCKNHYILDDCPHAAPKSPNTFRLRKLYSDPSGNVQVVQLLESAGLDDQHRWTGLTLVSTDRHGVSKRVTFSTDLPSAATAHRPVILTTFGASDFTIPPRFLPMDGGTLEFAGVDQWTFGPLPENGLFDLFRPTAPPQIPNETPTQFLTFENEVWEPRVRDELLVEFHHPATDRYFVTMFAQDFEAIDSGRVPGWVRTGGQHACLDQQLLQPRRRRNRPARAARRTPAGVPTLPSSAAGTLALLLGLARRMRACAAQHPRPDSGNGSGVPRVLGPTPRQEPAPSMRARSTGSGIRRRR